MVNRILSLLPLLLLAIPVSGDSVVEIVSRFDTLTVDPASVRLNPATALTTGRLRLTIDSGSAAYVRAGNEIVGIFVKGNGTLAYTTQDAIEFPVVRTTLKTTKSRANVTGDDKSLTISAPFKSFLWLSAGTPPPELKGEAAPSLASDFAAHEATSKLEIGGQRAPRFAMQKLNAPKSTTVRIELRGPEEWIYTRDEATDFFEALEKLYTIDFEDRSRRNERYSAIIAQEPLNGDRQKPPVVPALMTHVEYDITAVDQNAEIRVHETLTPQANGHHGLWFGLSETFYDSTGKKRHLIVREVTGADGAALPFAQLSGQVLVGLPAPTVIGKPVQVNFAMGGDILLRPSGDNYWLLRYWYPHFDLAGEAFTARGTVKVKAPFVPFAGGKTISRRSEEGFNIVETAFENPVGFLTVLAGKYHFEETRKDKLTIRTASYGQKNVAAIKKLTALAYDMIGYYEYFLGPFPFDELNIIEINDFGWGQAPPGIVFITSEAFQPLLGTLNQLYSEGINERFAHEIAHQYWGWSVRMPSLDEQWLTESFAEYSAALVLRKAQGERVYNRLVGHWRGNAKLARDKAPIPLANRIVVPNEFDFDRFYLLYGKGPYLLAALHKEVGEEMFLTFLKSYQKSFRYKFGTTKDVVGLLSFMTKKDYKPFFQTYYWGTELPDIK